MSTDHRIFTQSTQFTYSLSAESNRSLLSRLFHDMLGTFSPLTRSMRLNLLRKLKETSLSVVPIVLIVIVLNATIAPVGWAEVGRFAAGGAFIIVGLGLFLLGTEIGIVPVGQRVGSALTGKRSLPLLIAAGFAIGFLVTIAEPDVRVLARQIATAAPHLSRGPLVIAIAAGVGLFVAAGVTRVILGISYRWTLIVSYGIIALLAVLSDASLLGIAFDAGGATTGPMTVPFIIALGVGIASIRKSDRLEQDSFGFVGLASIGPVMAVLIMGLLPGENTVPTQTGVIAAGSPHASLPELVRESTVEVIQALGPLMLLFIVFQFTLLHQRRRQVIRMFQGIVYAAIGLILFFVGANGAFLPVGSALGTMVGASEHTLALIPIGFALGAVAVLAEPAVWVLTDEIHTVSGGHIPKKTMLVFLSIGVSIAVGLSMVRVVTRIDIRWFLVPGYAIALLLTGICPPTFTAIAFDSGGVASGPMSSTFVLAFTLGASASSGGNPLADAFGVIAMIAMIPLITIQILGILYARSESRGRDRTAKETRR